MMEFHVQDMTCGHCSGRITKAIKAVDADAVLKIDVASHLVQIESTTEVRKFDAAIRDAGYTPVLVN